MTFPYGGCGCCRQGLEESMTRFATPVSFPIFTMQVGVAGLGPCLLDHKQSSYFEKFNCEKFNYYLSLVL